MSLRLRNTWKYKGNDRWDWTIFLDDDGTGEIDNVAFVEYILHPTFPKPRRIETNRGNNFALITNGWGTFLIRAFANTKKGDIIKLEHILYLTYEPAEGETE